MCIKRKIIFIKKPIGIRFSQNLVDKLELKHIESSVRFIYKDRQINAKSIIGVLSMGFTMGDSFELIVSHSNEDIVNIEFPLVLKILEDL